jgi:hypothetical protein
MTALLERGTSPGRHPWYLGITGSGKPPNLPPDTKLVGPPGGEPPAEEDCCPRCRYVKQGLCGCGYDWDHWEWVLEETKEQG